MTPPPAETASLSSAVAAETKTIPIHEGHVIEVLSIPKLLKKPVAVNALEGRNNQHANIDAKTTHGHIYAETYVGKKSGQKKPHNEDALSMSETANKHGDYVVNLALADGKGSSPKAKETSALITRNISQKLPDESITTVIRDSIETLATNPEYNKGATTLIHAEVVNNEITFNWVGDSIGIVLRKNNEGLYEIAYATPPDSSAQRKLDKKILILEKAQNAQNTQILQEISCDVEPIIHSHTCRLQNGDLVLLMCDGYSDPINLKAIPVFENGDTDTTAINSLPCARQLQEIAQQANGDPIKFSRALTALVERSSTANKDDATVIVYSHEHTYDWEQQYPDATTKEQARQHHDYLLEQQRQHHTELTSIETEFLNIENLIKRLKGRTLKLKTRIQDIEQQLNEVETGGFSPRQTKELFSDQEKPFFEKPRQPLQYPKPKKRNAARKKQG